MKTINKKSRLSYNKRLKSRNSQLTDNKRNKAFAVLGIAFLIFQIASGLFLPRPTAAQEPTDENLCSVDVDAVLVMDTSGSMAEGEVVPHCDWWNLELVDTSYQWVSHTTNNVDQAWCDAKSQPPSRPSTFTPGAPKKIDAAKAAANSFIDKLQSQDQSALVSFNDTATLDKGLSNDHSATKTAIDALVTGGSTNIGDAIEKGVNELGSSRANSKAAKIIILLTDGMANKPNGDGYNENPLDVAYALDKAQAAADLGYKIFTIGLGSNGEIDETMLQNIADTTGAQYYHAPTQADLESIYNSIAQRICEYSSVSGCKYEDVAKDNAISGDPKLSGWEIILTNIATQATLSQETAADGCYTFAGLLAGSYSVAEGPNLSKQPFTATYPADPVYNITLAEGQNLTGIDFGNYLPPSESEAATLTVNKTVIGGTAQVSDFTLKVGAISVTSGQAAVFNAGTYAITEQGPANYTASFTGDCDAQGNITLAVGDNKICNLTNTFSGGGGEPSPQADLSVTKTVDDSTPDTGQTIVFTIRVTNAGPDAATGVILNDLLPAGLTFVSASSTQGTYNETTGVWSVGDLAKDASATLEIKATVQGEPGQTITNNVTAILNIDPLNNNNSASATITVNTPQTTPPPSGGGGGGTGGGGGGGNGPLPPSDAYQNWLNQQAAHPAPRNEVAGATTPQGEVKGASTFLPGTGFDYTEGFLLVIVLGGLIGIFMDIRKKIFFANN